MPLIAYQGAHGANDYPLHISFFEALQERGLLNGRYRFAIDPSIDLPYSQMLAERFPNTCLATDVSAIARARVAVVNRIGRGGRAISRFDTKFDGVIEAPGGHIHPLYTGGIDLFWRFPRARRKAIFFQSIERGALAQPEVRKSIADADVVVARTKQSAQNALETGCRNVVLACDIALNRQPQFSSYKVGVAAALRIPNSGADTAYLAEIRAILDYLPTVGPVDQVRIEEPLGAEQIHNQKVNELKGVHLWGDNSMYTPFETRRDAIISCRLHTTLLAMLAGNRRILQFQVEEGTSKIQEMAEDIGLLSLAVRPISQLNLRTVREFMESPQELPEQELANALKLARQRVQTGMDAVEDWLASIPA